MVGMSRNKLKFCECDKPAGRPAWAMLGLSETVGELSETVDDCRRPSGDYRRLESSIQQHPFRDDLPRVGLAEGARLGPGWLRSS
jgi:hypothetical protein